MLTKITPKHGKFFSVAQQSQNVLQNALYSIRNSAPTWEEIRKTRDTLLKVSDWTQAPDSPLSQEKRTEWAAYRQQLRDITEQDINNIVWPKEPTKE